MQSALIPAFPSFDPAVMRAAVVAELVPVIAAAVDPQTWDPRELGVGGGNIFPAVIWQEKIWYRDPTDAVTAHDGISCIVTLDGSRYKTNEVVMPRAVLSRIVNDPPGAPDLGDAYLVPAAATGAWAPHDDQVAVWTARGWAYKPPARGDLLYIEDELGYIHRTAADAWANGIGSYALLAGSIHPQNLLIRDWNVENQTTNNPPALGPAGEQYVIGPVPAGAWAGNAKRLAFRPVVNAAFVILAPFVGEEIYDKATGIRYRWDAANWISTAGAIVESNFIFEDIASGVLTESAGPAIYATSNTVAPTTAQRRTPDPAAVFNIKSRRVGQKIRFRWSAEITFSNAGDAGAAAGDCVIGLWRDAEVNALKWVKVGARAVVTMINAQAEMIITTDDQLMHAYSIAIMSNRDGVGDRWRLQGGSLARRLYSFEMFS